MLALGLAGFAQRGDAQASCDVIVNGQNNPAVDVPAVASAVNAPPAAGDVTVCLAGTFDFGPPPAPPAASTVSIAPAPSVTALRILGVNDANGKKATIRGGFQALTLTPAATLPSFAIENLRFVRPALSAISILRANGSVRISGVNIADVQSYFFPAFGGRFREGIAVSSLAPVTGEIVIADSVIDGGTYGLDDTTLAVSAGIVLTGAFGNNQPFTARVRISDNKLADWSGSGILLLGVNEATIERNRIDPGAFANMTPGCASANGMGAANGISLAGVDDSTVRDNVIVLEPALTGAGTPPPCSAALMLAGNAANGADGNIVYRNRIRGSGTYALVVGMPSGTTEVDNLFALNPVGNFVPTIATLSIGPGTSGNSFVGSFPSVTGNVAGNVIITR